MIHLNPIEVGWLSVNLIAAVLTIIALIEARADWAILRAFNGSARGIVARATIRRETFRLGSQVALLLVAVPSIFSDREVVLTLPLVALLTVPVFILANTLSDRRMRHAIAHKLEADIVKERDASLERMEARLNAKADIRAGRLNARADERAGIVTEQADELQAVADDTADKVTDVQTKVTDLSERTS